MIMINELDPRSIAEMFSEHLDEEELKEMLSDGGIDLDELTTIFAKIGRKLSTKEIEKFNKLDKNKNGKVEKYELGSVGEARGIFSIVGVYAVLYVFLNVGHWVAG